MSARNPLRLGASVLLLLALAACQGQQSGDEQASQAEPSESEQAQTSNDGNESSEGKDMSAGNADRMSLEEAVDAARQDLAGRSGVTPESISVVEAKNVTWRNGALGCPEEGMMYTQALVEGFYILLDDGEGEHAYHAGRDGKPFFCPAERSQPPLESDQEKPLS